MKKLLLLSVVAVIAVITACKKDNNAPTPGFVDLNDFSLGTVVQAGDSLDVIYTATDNEGLKSVTIEINKGYAFEEAPVAKSGFDWSAGNIVSLSGTSIRKVTTFEIPTTVAAGTYHVKLVFEDESGNKSAPVFRGFVIKSNNQPVWDMEMLHPENDGFRADARRGDEIVLSGSVSSSTDLQQIKVDIIDIERSVYSRFIELPGGNDQQFDFDNFIDSSGDTIQIFVPAEAVTRDHIMLIQATDAAGLTGTKLFYLDVPF